MLAIPATLALLDGGECDGNRVDLIAGEMSDVGDVRVWNDAETLYVRYMTQGGWHLVETHLHVADSLEAIPSEDGVPQPGLFDHSGRHFLIDEFTYRLPLEWEEGDELLIAAQATVCGCEGLPDMAAMTLLYPSEGDASHFAVTVTDEDMGGEYLGWCVDIDMSISQGIEYDVMVHSSLGDVPEGVIDRPENLDMVNWMLDQDIVGAASPGGHGNYTYGDVQVAIWRLLEDPGFENLTTFTSLKGGYDEERVAEIIAAAEEGEGFFPAQGDEFGVILLPVNGDGDTIAQTLVVEFTKLCGPEDAWGNEFPCEELSMNFTHVVTGEES